MFLSICITCAVSRSQENMGKQNKMCFLSSQGKVWLVGGARHTKLYIFSVIFLFLTFMAAVSSV